MTREEVVKRANDKKSLDADEILREKLADSLAVKTYFELLECVGAKRVNTRDFRRKFNRFCMVRRGEAWQSIYYGLFQELTARRRSVTLRDILPELDSRIKAKLKQDRLEVSFSSKMLAFLRPTDFPIWDSWVVKNMLEHNGMDLRLSVKGNVKAREKEALKHFDELTAWFRNALRTKAVQKAVRRFNDYLPEGMGEKVSDMKKFDWLMWAKRPE